MQCLANPTRSYFTSASSAALVAGPAARGVQDSDARPPVLVRSCPGIPCRWLSACHRRSRKTTAFQWHEDADCPPNLQLFRGHDLCSYGHKSVEQFPGWLTKGRVVILPVQAVAQDVFISTVRIRRIVNFSFLTEPCRNILTYLLTYNSNFTARLYRQYCVYTEIKRSN